MKSVKISIVTPSFNQGKYIEDAIRSVKEQGYENFEHIIMDNCSTDNTLEVLRKYPHVKYVSEPDEGQSDALNKGFQRATGDIIGWLNADDYYLPGTFQKVNEIFSKAPDTDAIYSNVRFINGAGEHLHNLTSHRPLKWLSLFYTFIQSTTLFFRREIVDSGILLDKDLNLLMDRDFYVRLLYGGYKLKYVDAYFAAFRWHETNKSGIPVKTRRESTLEGLKIINKNTRWNLKSDKATIFLYKNTVKLVAKPVRGFLKLLPSHY